MDDAGDVRVTVRNERPERAGGRFVVYWMIASRRVRANRALARAVDAARRLGVPLVILEALRADYRWANDRLHQFVIEGMADNANALAGQPVTYWPYVEPAIGAGKGLLEALSADACLIVTDDYPCFFLPRMVATAAARVPVRLEAVDSNGLLPMRATDRAFPTAFSFRAYVQRTVRPHFASWPGAISFDGLASPAPLPPSIAARWPATPAAELADPARLVAALPIDHSVAAAPIRGGAVSARRALDRFVNLRLTMYADAHSHPDLEGTSGLSPYLHFGHLAATDVFDAVMTAEGWTSRQIAPGSGGRREGWWGASRSAEAFLDQLVTWRELGFNLCVTEPAHAQYRSLPVWARATLDFHAADRRPYIYSRRRFEQAATHDPVWNAAQRQLTRDGWMHNYLRMLWGKKILEWTPAPDEALETMIEVMNRFALDGRDPNSYSGYTWTLGRYDRPWPPERPVVGTIRYMSSTNTVKKLKIKQYLDKYRD